MPRRGKGGANGCGGKAARCQENFASTTEVMVEWIDNEGAAGGIHQYQLSKDWSSPKQGSTYMRPAVKKMIELINPTIQASLPGPVRPNSLGKDKLAPLAPV